MRSTTRSPARALAQVLVTHGHVDHASGAPALAERLPGTRFLKMPWPERDSRWPCRVGADCATATSIEAGDDALRAVHTPGHAPDHLCFWHEESRTLFCGDLASKGTTVVYPAESAAATWPTISRRSSACSR